MKEPKLFTKNVKGRYEPYVVPKADISDTLYRKVNGRFVPWGIELRMDSLSEGVWVVMRHRSSREVIAGQYLRECFSCDRVSGLEDVPLSRLASMEKYVSRVLDDLRQANVDIYSMSMRDLVQRIVGLIFHYDEELKMRSTTIPITGSKRLGEYLDSEKKEHRR